MPNWSAEAAKRDNERQVKAELRLERFVRDRRIISTQGGVEWARLRSALGAKCREFNEEPGKWGLLSCDANLLSCRVWITGREFSISGHYSEGIIRFRAAGSVHFGAHWEVKLTEDGLGIWLRDERGQAVTVEDIAEKVIEILLAARQARIKEF